MPRTPLVILDTPDVASLRGPADLPRARLDRYYSTEPCSNCAASCCSAKVELTTVEALRVAHGLRIAVEAVVQRIDCPPNLADRMASVPIPLDDGLTVLRLRHSAAGACVFLQRLLEQGRCAAHAHRPALCHFFPFRFRVNERTLSMGDPAVCPARWVKSAALEAALRRVHARWRRDFSDEKRLVRDWERAGGAARPWREYAEFAARWVEARRKWTRPAWMLVPATRAGWRK
ncbi:MAG: YkgJ family cysteine cluster protein [Deltaproteobacteria bacterium]|nr:YkgJ family cysteine cluster protein [Deltaproteobacteria bacterium]